MAVSRLIVYPQMSDTDLSIPTESARGRHGWVNTWLSNFLNWKEEQPSLPPSLSPSKSTCPDDAAPDSVCGRAFPPETKFFHFAHFKLITLILPVGRGVINCAIMPFCLCIDAQPSSTTSERRVGAYFWNWQMSVTKAKDRHREGRFRFQRAAPRFLTNEQSCPRPSLWRGRNMKWLSDWRRQTSHKKVDILLSCRCT